MNEKQLKLSKSYQNLSERLNFKSVILSKPGLQLKLFMKSEIKKRKTLFKFSIIIYISYRIFIHVHDR